MWLHWLLCALLSKFFICNIVQFVMYKMAVLSKTKSHFDAVDYFKELPFYNKPMKKPKVKRLKNIDRLAKLFLQRLCYRYNLLWWMFLVPCDNWKMLFFLKVCRYCEIISTLTLSFSLKQMFWKKSVFYVISTVAE